MQATCLSHHPVNTVISLFITSQKQIKWQRKKLEERWLENASTWMHVCMHHAPRDGQAKIIMLPPPIEWAASHKKSQHRRSAVVFIVCSVPQGSVLGSLLFVLYVADLVNVMEKHGLRLYAYADDSQLTLHFRRDELAVSIERLERCIEDVISGCLQTDWCLMSTKRNGCWSAQDVLCPR